MTDDPFTVQGTDGNVQYEPIEAGVHQAALACIVHNPNVPGYQGVGTVNECIFVWVTPTTIDSQGAPKQIRKTTSMPPNPMHPKANFRQMVESWIGVTLTPEQIANFNMRKMLGARCTLVTSVATSAAGRKYVKVTSIAKAAPDAPGLPAGIVVRVTTVTGQLVIAAEGVKVEVKAAAAQAQKPVQVADIDMPF